MTNETHSPDSIAVAERVRELMSRHGIGKRQQTTELCRILDLSFSQGHRKLRGNSPWTLSQIKKVAEVFGEPAAQLFGAQSLDPGMVGAIAQEAVFCIGAIELPCTAWFGACAPTRRHRRGHSMAGFACQPRTRSRQLPTSTSSMRW